MIQKIKVLIEKGQYVFTVVDMKSIGSKGNTLL